MCRFADANRLGPRAPGTVIVAPRVRPYATPPRRRHEKPLRGKAPRRRPPARPTSIGSARGCPCRSHRVKRDTPGPSHLPLDPSNLPICSNAPASLRPTHHDRQARHPREAGLPEHCLPAEDRFPHEGRPPAKGAGHSVALAGSGSLPHPARPSRRPRKVHPPRWPALCEWQHPRRPRAEPHPQGHGRPHPEPLGQGRALRPRLGLPRPADRMEGGRGIPQEEAQQGRGSPQGIPRRMPRLCADMGQRPARTTQAPRRQRRLGPPLPDDGPASRRHHRRRTAQIRRIRPTLPRLKAGNVVPRRKDRPRRSRSRIRGHHLDANRRRLRNHRFAHPRTDRRPRRHLDHHPLDHPHQSGHRLWGGRGLCAFPSDGFRHWP